MEKPAYTSTRSGGAPGVGGTAGIVYSPVPTSPAAKPASHGGGGGYETTIR